MNVTDPSGAAVKASVELKSASNGYEKSFMTDPSGILTVKQIPYGLYRLLVQKAGFQPAAETVEVRSALPLDSAVHLGVAPILTSVTVTDSDSLIDPNRPSSVMQIGSQQIDQRLGSLPGRSVQDLVNSQPGWLYEGNAVLHPRGSEYQTQFVIDGIPLTDNRSPGFGPEIEADDLESLSIYTAGYPAEFGRKMGGVVDIDTRRQTDAGLHGRLVLAGGSYDTASSYGQLQDVWNRNTLSASASGSMSSHYLNPVVPQNFTNRGTTGDFSLRYEREISGSDRLTLNVRHALSRFLVPNELIQQQAGQVQNGDNFETLGTVSYQHIFSPDSLGTLAAMGRDNANNFYSNPASTPILAFQHNSFREVYFKGTFSLHRGRQELKAGFESDNNFLHENFSYQIADASQFDPGTPATFAFAAHRPDLEQSAFVEDLVRLGNWTLSVGLRWDHYQLLRNDNAFSPRLTVGRFIPALDMVLHVSYDRVFQTPNSHNILVSSSTQIEALNQNFLRLPVKPSHGDYFEGGLTQSLRKRLRLDVNLYRRSLRNFADDDQLLNTGVSYPIAFDRSVIYGAEGKLELVHAGRFTGFVSYSYMVGKVWYPVTGGLFLGDNAASALSQLSGHFPASQDQRNTVRTRFRYQVAPRLWIAAGAASNSGLPFQYTGTRTDALAQYGSEVIDRINFDRGRILPQYLLNASMGLDLYSHEKVKLRLQIDTENLTNTVNVIDFGGLFSGNAIGPTRSYSARLKTSF